MNKEQIKKVAYQRMSLIEDLCGKGYVDPPLQAYWRLNYVIAEGFQKYFASFGWLPIDSREADEGRELFLGLGKLSLFELDVIQILDQKIKELERPNIQRQIRLVD